MQAVIVSGTEEGSLIVWDMSHENTRVNHLQMAHELQVPPQIQLRVPSFHSDLEAEDDENQVRKIHHSAKILDLDALPVEDDVSGHKCCLLVSIDECGVAIIWWAFPECCNRMNVGTY